MSDSASWFGGRRNVSGALPVDYAEKISDQFREADEFDLDDMIAARVELGMSPSEYMCGGDSRMMDFAQSKLRHAVAAALRDGSSLNLNELAHATLQVIRIAMEDDARDAWERQ